MKKIILTLFSFILLSSSAFAEVLTADVTVENGLVTGEISISEYSKSDKVSVQIKDEEGNYNYIDILYVDTEGKTGFEYMNNGESGVYSVDVYAIKQNERLNFTFKYYDADDRLIMIDEFKGILSGNGTASEYIGKYPDVINISDYYTMISNKKNFDDTVLAIGGEVSTMSDINKVLNESILVTVINEKKDAAFTEEILSDEDFSEIMSFVTDSEGKPLINILNDDIKKAFYYAVANSGSTSGEELTNLMKNSLLTKGIKHAAFDTEVQLILEAYADCGLINLSPSKNIKSVSKGIRGRTYTDILAVESAYNNYTETIINNGGYSGGGGGSSGGSSGVKNVSGVIAYAPETESKINTTKQIFTDIELSMWASDAINKTVEKGILSGMGDGTFNPTGELTRAQAAIILYKLAGLENTDKVFEFNDVNTGDWYFDYVNAVVDAGIFYGVSDNEFGVNVYLTREQAATVFARYLQSKGVTAEIKELKFDDIQDISDWAAESVQMLVSLNIISGKTDKLFAPKQPLLRSEAAVIIAKILDLTDKG